MSVGVIVDVFICRYVGPPVCLCVCVRACACVHAFVCLFG